VADAGVDIIFEAAVEILVWLNAEKVSTATKQGASGIGYAWDEFYHHAGASVC
jgi:hypothetical protein